MEWSELRLPITIFCTIHYGIEDRTQFRSDTNTLKIPPQKFRVLYMKYVCSACPKNWKNYAEE